MSHNNHVVDGVNKDLNPYYTREKYLELTENFVSALPDPVITEHEGVHVLRDDILIGGTKTRAAEFMFENLDNDTVVYVCPRVGMAGVAIAQLCKMYNKKFIAFMPACKKVSHHQAFIASLADKVIFHRIAAMPNLNRLARNYANYHGYSFLPFGLDHPHVIAGLVRVAHDLIDLVGDPDHVWSVVSTGVLTRGLQIGFNQSEFNGVCVARNMKAGELGRVSNPISEPLAFNSNEKECNLPPFPSIKSYDAKAWKYIPKNTDDSILFWNVACEPPMPDKEFFDQDSFLTWAEESVLSSKEEYQWIS